MLLDNNNTMAMILALFIFLLQVSGRLVYSSSDSGIKGPPHVTGSVAGRQTFRLGDTIRLDCPIRGTPTPIIEWSKDGDSVTAGWERFKPTNHGLRIKEALLDDSGEYTCKGVNGFGSTQVTFEVVIVDPNAKPTEPPPASETVLGPDGETETMDPATWKKLMRGSAVQGSSPLLVETSHVPAGRLWQLPADSTLRLKCVAQGEPEPHLIWLKDGREVGEDRRIGRWELQVSRLNVDDSGTYSCKAVNPYGSINASFAVQVVDRSIRKPEFVGPYPQNITVMEGSSARLQCRVISDTPLFLQWLKRLERVPIYGGIVPDGRPDADGILQFEGWRYRVLRSGHPAFQADDGSYLDKLALDDVSVDQAGLYLCVATNSAGHSFREATLSVLLGAGRLPPGDLSSAGGNGGGLPTVAVIALPVGAVAVLFLAGWIIYYVKSAGSRKKMARPSPSAVGSGKDLNGGGGVTTPCLPRHPPDQHHPPHPHLGPPPELIRQQQQHIPYSTPFMGGTQQPQEMMRIHHGGSQHRSAEQQPMLMRSTGGGTSASSANSNSSGLIYLNGGTNWASSNVYRPPPCGRSVDRTNGYNPYYGQQMAESEHAYASIHGGLSGEDFRPINVHQPLLRNSLPFSSNGSGVVQQQMV